MCQRSAATGAARTPCCASPTQRKTPIGAELHLGCCSAHLAPYLTFLEHRYFWTCYACPHDFFLWDDLRYKWHNDPKWHDEEDQYKCLDQHEYQDYEEQEENEEGAAGAVSASCQSKLSHSLQGRHCRSEAAKL